MASFFVKLDKIWSQSVDVKVVRGISHAMLLSPFSLPTLADCVASKALGTKSCPIRVECQYPITSWMRRDGNERLRSHFEVCDFDKRSSRGWSGTATRLIH
jgi:hypothetical protein